MLSFLSLCFVYFFLFHVYPPLLVSLFTLFPTIFLSALIAMGSITSHWF
jgi:hypothetical protein